MKKEIKIIIDLEPITEQLNKYIKKKMIEEIKIVFQEEANIDFPEVHFPDIEKRLEKLEDWKNDIEKGWIKLK